MTQIPFESFKDKLIAEIRQTPDFASLEDRLLDAQMEMDCADEMETDEDLLVKILQLSHQKVLEGKTYSQTEVEKYLDERLLWSHILRESVSN